MIKIAPHCIKLFALAPLMLIVPLTDTSWAKPATAPKQSAQIIPQRQRICTAKTKSGLGYKVLRKGSGDSPGARDVVLVGYIGYFANSGAIFDESKGAAFPVGGVVAGFSEGLKLMHKGEIMRLCIPSKLGYGQWGAGPVPPNADLVFQVELKDFKPQ